MTEECRGKKKSLSFPPPGEPLTPQGPRTSYQPAQELTLIFLRFHTVHWVLNARIPQWFAIPFSSVPHLAERSTMTLLSWVVLHCMAHTFIQLNKEFYKLFIKGFIVFYYTFKFVVHFEFVFVRDMCCVWIPFFWFYVHI